MGGIIILASSLPPAWALWADSDGKVLDRLTLPEPANQKSGLTGASLKLAKKAKPGKDSSAGDDQPADTADSDKGDATPDKTFSGNCSWYGIPFHGRKTASGEIFNMNKLSAAHRKFPLPTYCLVEDPRSGNTVIVKVNDRGPYAKGRVMDLSREAARQLGTLSRGVAYIEGTVLGKKAKP